ncbi:MAG: TRAP transporter substrate-binding protein DctP [Pseudomonadota bacterium]
MERRSFIKKAAVGAAAGAIAAPALAQTQPTFNWRMASSFPKSLETLFGTAEFFSKRLSQLTNGKFNIRPFAGGEIVPPFEVMNAVQNGTVEMAHTVSQYFAGKDATFSFDSGLPFGLNSRQQTAWVEHGGGKELLREFFKEYGIVNFLGGNTGTQMGGFFRKEMKTVKDLQGLKFRIGGLAGRAFVKLGAVPQQIPAGDVYSALEKGTIDAAEFVGPADDEKLGFSRVAPFYYAPGWWDAGPQVSFYVGIKEWEKLPPDYKAAFESASREAHLLMQAQYDARNPAALARILKSGGKLRMFSKEIMDACYKASEEVLQEEAGKNAKFKAMLDPWLRFRRDQNQWFSVAEAPMQNYMASRSNK